MKKAKKPDLRKVRVKTLTDAKRENKLFPGKPNYTGPDKGWFAWVHHGKLFEHTRCDGNSITARVGYVREVKPRDERAIRLDHIMYLGKALGAKLTAMRHNTDCPYSWHNMCHYGPAVTLVKAYIRRHKPKNKWNEGYRSLVKANGRTMGG